MSTNHDLARQAVSTINMVPVDMLTDDDCADFIADTYAPAFDELERLRSGGWIKCSERIPAIGEHVLFYDGICRVHYGWRSALSGQWHSQTTAVSYPLNGIDHWQPLPEPPKDGT